MDEEIESYENDRKNTSCDDRPFLPSCIYFRAIDCELVDRPSDDDDEYGVAMIDDRREQWKRDEQKRKTTDQKKK